METKYIHSGSSTSDINSTKTPLSEYVGYPSHAGIIFNVFSHCIDEKESCTV